MLDTDLKKIWLDFAHDAAARYTPPDDVEGAEALVDDMSAVATDYADAMLDAFEERVERGEFDGARAGRRSAKGRGRRRGGDEPGGD